MIHGNQPDSNVPPGAWSCLPLLWGTSALPWWWAWHLLVWSGLPVGDANVGAKSKCRVCTGEVHVHCRWGMKATSANAGFQLTRAASQAPQIMNSARERVKARALISMGSMELWVSRFKHSPDKSCLRSLQFGSYLAMTTGFHPWRVFAGH